MNNRIGLGVFGTFGDPHGYQQEFYSNVRFVNSLDLNEFAIEFYPGADLYSVKREIIDGVYTVCFCIYTYARELNTERFGTFIGSCIVLQDSYTDADYIYQSLKELHKSILTNPEYLKGNTINVATAKDIYVTEPSHFIAARANAIPISKTPFFTPYVDPQKNYLVLPDTSSNNDIDTNVLQFFEEAQKYHNDTTTLYFSTDSNVADFVKQEEILDTQDWYTFTGRKQEALKTAVVRTKKGVHKPAAFNDDSTAIPEQEPDSTSFVNTYTHDTPAISNTTEEQRIDTAHQPYLPKNTDSYLTDEDDDDPYKPFDLWDEPIPETGWNKQETTYRVKEYNRLFRYTNVLLEHIHQPSANDKESMPRKKKLIIALLVTLLLVGAGVVYFIFFYNKSSNNPPKFKSGNNTEKSIDTATPKPTDTPNPTPVAEPNEEANKDSKNDAEKVKTETEAPKNVEKSTTATNTKSEQTNTNENKSVSITPATAIESAETGSIYVPGKEVPSSTTSVSMIPGDLKPKTLHPRPNIQLTQNDIPALKEVGVKDKTLSELIKILFESSPQNIGYIYKGQEQQYGALLVSNNKIFFKRTTNDYICTADQQLLHIPAYNSPRLPAVYPK